MICYRDRTFCEYWRECDMGKECGRALTKEVRDAADRLRLYICRFAAKPQCFVKKEKKDAAE